MRETANSTYGSQRLLTVPVTFTPTTALRVQEAVLSFVLSPIALISLFLSAGSLTGWAAVGQPLSSPEAALGLTLSGLLLLRVGMSATRTTSGLLVTALWALVFTGLSEIMVAIFRPAWLQDPTLTGTPQMLGNMVELALTLAWSDLPTLVFTVCSAAFFTARIARKIRKKRLLVDGLANPTAGRIQARTLAIVDLLAVTFLWLSTVDLAPTNITAVAAYGPAALGVFGGNLAPVLLAAFGLIVLTLSAGWSALETAAISTLLLLLPSAVIVPVSSTLTGSVAAPGAAEATAVSLAGPLVQCLSVLLIALTFGLHWVQTVTAPELAVCD